MRIHVYKDKKKNSTRNASLIIYVFKTKQTLIHLSTVDTRSEIFLCCLLLFYLLLFTNIAAYHISNLWIYQHIVGYSMSFLSVIVIKKLEGLKRRHDDFHKRQDSQKVISFDQYVHDGFSWAHSHLG